MYDGNKWHTHEHKLILCGKVAIGLILCITLLQKIYTQKEIHQVSKKLLALFMVMKYTLWDFSSTTQLQYYNISCYISNINIIQMSQIFCTYIKRVCHKRDFRI